MEIIKKIQAELVNPFGDLMGLEFVELEPGMSRCILDAKRDIYNPNARVHGGAIYTMADSAMGIAVHLALEQGQLCATREIQIRYFKGVTEGQISCCAKMIHKDKHNVYLEAEIRNKGQLIAKASGTFTIYTPSEKKQNNPFE